MPEARTDWSSTVHLPKTEFPQKGDLARREPELLKAWESLGLYERMQERQAGRPPFVLHDGPPYANGRIHIGHAQNKILKDMVVKSQALLGRAAPYVPGWDCHGLPIETALLKEKKMSKRGVVDVPAFRRDAAAFAERFIGLQRDEFKRLGVLGDWSHPYTTMSRGYETAILRAFRLLVQKGHVYRGLKPVLWCPTCETALADAEVEYQDKTSPSVYVALTVVDPLTPELKGAELVVWTTTPWTLPANRAVAFNPNLEYVLVEAGGRRLIVAAPRLAAVAEALGLGAPKVLKSWNGADLASAAPRYALPYPAASGNPGAAVAADYVTAEDGSGLVHTAPGHGEDDFDTGMREGLEIYNPVGGDGRYDDTVPEFLRGKHILKEGNALVVEDLAKRGLLLAKKDISHSYPHCWRCKNPVIFRTTEQWFLRLSEALRAHLLEQIDGARWVPPESRNRIAAMIENRPDWCLSRQRVWGAPIPVLYSLKTGAPVLDDGVLQAVERHAAANGLDFWFERWGEALKPADWPFLPPHPDLADGFRRETDILDVWLDSGVSWLAVLGEDAVADLYLEGSDQHRGWFQSSLVMATALRGRAPFKAVYTHGFVLDEKGRAMHKSAGNVVAPDEVVGKHGADVLRAWVALADVHQDTRISENLLKVPAEAYRRVRNTLRYLLGCLDGFAPGAAVPYERLPALERHVLHRLSELQRATLDDYREYRWRDAARRLIDFCSFDLSAFYLDVTKDRMYTLRADAPERRAVQTVQAELLARLCALLSPILSFTADEAWRFWAGRPADSVFLWDLPAPDPRWTDAAGAARWEKALAARAAALKALEEARAAKTIGKSTEAKVVLRGPAEDLAPLAGLDLAELLIVSQAALEPGAAELSAAVTRADGEKCPRCWRWQADVGSDPGQPELCGRCARQL
ncbi:MAG: isoleucine--tRNA ligase [Elusimicrobia bacterium]|nr:isoleucine--tRNA ligase [Elusimicrobiota bacterium]